MIRKLLFAALLSSALTPAFAQEVPPVDEEAPGDAIVVTGQKLNQTLTDTPNSVVVATGEEIDDPAYRTVNDFLEEIPNVTFTSGGFLPAVRGVDGNGVAAGGNGAVSGGRPRLTTYVDGVPRSYSFVPNGVPVTWDIGQLEFYRGAQSTAIGRNAIAGAIVVQTTDPKDEWEGAAELGIRSEETTYNGAATVNAPLIADRLALRVSVDGYKGENFIDYVGPLAPVDEFIDRDEGYRVRAKLSFRPNGFADDLSFRLAYERQHVRSPSTRDAVSFTAGFYENDDPFNISVFELDNELVSLEANVPLGGGFSAYGIAAYQKSHERGLPIFDDGSSLDVFANSKEFSQEARIAYHPEDSRLKAVVGLFHFDRDRNEGGVPGSAFVYDADDQGSTVAFFADAVVPLGDFDILAGARWEKERQDREFLADFGLALDVDIEQSIFLPKGGLRWNLGENHTLTALYYRGYSPAAAGVSFLTFTPYQFRRETSDSVELAWRLEQGAVTVNANIFVSFYNDEQIGGAGPNGPADAIIINAEETRYYGAEGELKWRASPWLTLTGALGLLGTEIVRFGGDPSNDLNNGNRLPSSPTLTSRLAVRAKPGEGLSIDADLRYNSDYFSAYENTPSTRVRGGVLVDARASYDFGAVTLYAYADNIFDRRYLTSRDTDFGSGNAGRPRTFGAAARAQF